MEQTESENVSRRNNQIIDWQLSKKGIRERGKFILENPTWSDCSFLVGSEHQNVKEFSAHKLILSMSSPVFDAMFNGCLPESQSPIKITDVQPEAFKSMLEYIYTDQIRMDSLDQACELCYVAKKYMLPYLLENCMEYIWKDVDSDTAIRAYEFAKLFDESIILQKAMKTICEQTSEVLTKPGSLSMDLGTFLDILDQDQLNVPSEAYLFNILQSWILVNYAKSDTGQKFDTAKMREMARPALKKVRFLTMDAPEFADKPAQSDLLTKDESFAILMNIASPQTKYPMPDGFCRTRHGRTNPSRKIVCLTRKLYVQRAVINPTVRMNNGTLADCIHFVANDNITLLGIQVPTQIIHIAINTTEESSSPMEMSARVLAESNSKYRELIIMYVKEVRNPENNWFTQFTTLVEFNSVMNIMFTTPAVIKKGYEYELGITLNKEGYYLVGSFERMVEKYCDNVQFVLSGTNNSAFISSLIFTH